MREFDRTNQGKSVRELIRVTKPNGRIVIIYGNPNAPLMLVQRFLKLLRINKLLKKDKLYIYMFPVSWWSQFCKSCVVNILPNDCISKNQAKALLPFTNLRHKFYSWASRMQNNNPESAVRLWSYVTIVLDKRASEA